MEPTTTEAAASAARSAIAMSILKALGLRTSKVLKILGAKASRIIKALMALGAKALRIIKALKVRGVKALRIIKTLFVLGAKSARNIKAPNFCRAKDAAKDVAKVSLVDNGANEGVDKHETKRHCCQDGRAKAYEKTSEHQLNLRTFSGASSGGLSALTTLQLPQAAAKIFRVMTEEEKVAFYKAYEEKSKYFHIRFPESDARSEPLPQKPI